ncbi:ester cyclase [Burkholderia oklahomensis]|uniref:SnoaL-like polyketide cyclase family protein n=1 Tax=Burkholderia oklahomensis TaxID=342113 RepID=A0AAI8FND9_9BURK|nr:ester cyclase [Burkholderia oklahomensis]AIO66657.1 snoaL-like polyketide cyclase family protein [Burkholderia oklahomensis]AJX31482.1 snoaL-like polyketide cyclase family protein [Burkholderia oklahomensis C6786]AOI42696.1 polyketide cyclase [Burkholderia oklahomensis EO147]AOI46190.1 polyketide cyclase [Burkholderia oklahomensis C6786]KUY57282.1 polyketide cyclase [Burkholderia oklahomensis EO147]
MLDTLRRHSLPATRAAAALLLAAALAPARADPAGLIEPRHLSADRSLPAAQRDAQILAARRYDTFWHDGDPALARAALADDFADRTPPPGRAPGLAGPLAASRTMREAIPDMSCEIEQMIVAGDRVVVHLRFRGHFTGTFEGAQGKGQAIDFIATDIYRVERGRIAENWHIEDNLTLLRQLGVAA